MSKKVYYSGQLAWTNPELRKCEMVLVHHQWWYYGNTREQADKWWLECQRKSAIAVLKRIHELILEQSFYEEAT